MFVVKIHVHAGVHDGHARPCRGLLCACDACFSLFICVCLGPCFTPEQWRTTPSKRTHSSIPGIPSAIGRAGASTVTSVAVGRADVTRRLIFVVKIHVLAGVHGGHARPCRGSETLELKDGPRTLALSLQLCKRHLTINRLYTAVWRRSCTGPLHVAVRVRRSCRGDHCEGVCSRCRSVRLASFGALWPGPFVLGSACARVNSFRIFVGFFSEEIGPWYATFKYWVLNTQAPKSPRTSLRHGQ